MKYFILTKGNRSSTKYNLETQGNCVQVTYQTKDLNSAYKTNFDNSERKKDNRKYAEDPDGNSLEGKMSDSRLPGISSFCPPEVD